MSWYTKMTDTGNSFIVQTKRRSLRVLGAPDVIDGSTASEFRALGASTSSPAFRAKITGTTNGHGPNTGASISQRRCAQRFLASILRLTFIFDGLRRALPPYPPEVAESLGRRVSIPSRPPSAIGGLNNCKAMRRTTGTSLTVNSSSVFAIAVRIGFPGSASLVDLGFSKTGSTKRGNHELLSFTENRFLRHRLQPTSIPSGLRLSLCFPTGYRRTLCRDASARFSRSDYRESPDRTIRRASFRGCRIS